MSKKNIPYWIHGYCKLICSECGYVIDENADMQRYLYFRKEKGRCPGCDADMREPLKACYIKQYYPDTFNSCGDVIYVCGRPFCYRQTRERTQELRAWGCYYKCEGFKPKSEQLTLW